MNIQIGSGNFFEAAGDIAVVFLFHKKQTTELDWPIKTKKLDELFDGELSRSLTRDVFEPVAGAIYQFRSMGKAPVQTLYILGGGSASEVSANSLRKTILKLAAKLKVSSAKTISIHIPEQILETVHSDVTGKIVSESLSMGMYSFTPYKKVSTKTEAKKPKDIVLFVPRDRQESVKKGIDAGVVSASAVAFTRDLVNEPPSVTTPTYLAEIAYGLAKQDKAISCTVLGKAEMKKLGMEGILGIARGGREEPKFIVLTYSGSTKDPIVFVGKGITFDTGGLSMKTPSAMETMKLDMAGGAAVLGIFHALTVLKPKTSVIGIIPATENMPSGDAIKPGDVVRISNGTSVEILNTDAEGRIVLADALSYAQKNYSPKYIVDFATLTGACIVALGEKIAGMFANTDDMAQTVKAAARNAGELVWELPLAGEYKSSLKSSVADLKNVSGGKYGGAITAALFLQEFIQEATPWVHIDIAGPAWADKDSVSSPRGGTGFGVRTGIELIMGESS